MIVHRAWALMLFSTAALAAPESLLVVLKEQAIVERPDIRLVDVAEVRTSDARLRERLQALRVGLVPRDSGHSTVRRDDVLRLVNRIEGAAHATADGATAAKVSLRANEYRGARLIELARDHLRRFLVEQTPTLTRIDIEPTGAVPDLRLPDGTVTVSPRPISANGAWKRTCVWLDVKVGGRLHRSVPVWLSVSSYAPVVVAKRSLKPRERIEPADVAVEERDIAGINQAPPFTTTATFAGQRARTFIPAGAIVQSKDVEPNPSVVAAEMVDVRVTAGSILIETQGIAEQDGHIGDYVKVRNPKTAETFSAKVVGENLVAITAR